MKLGFPGWRSVGIAFGLGAIMATGQAPLGWWFLTLPALAALLHFIAQGTARRAAWLGWFGGAGYFGAALNWITQPFLVDAATYGWMAPFALVLLAFGMALFWAAACGIGMRAHSPLTGLVTALSAAELLRGYVLTGFPWALIGHVWIDTPPVQIAALIGPSGMTLLTIAVAGLAASLRPALVAAAAVTLAALWSFGLWQLAQPVPPSTGLTLRLVQPDAPQDAKWNPDNAQRYFDRLMNATAAPGKVDLVIWPETALPYLLEGNPDLPGLIGAAGNGAPVVVGLQRVERNGAEVRGWNSLQIFGPDGSVLASYDKQHLVPFGEYIPFGDLAYDWFGITAFAARLGRSYSAGPGPVVLDLGPKLGRVLPLICYEAVFPQDLRAATRPGWLLQITNDAWFGTMSGPFQHAAQARLRAVEQGLPLVRVANTGVTEMVDARGRVTAALPFGAPGYLDAALPGALPATPYARFGEIPVLLLLAGCAALAIFRRRDRAA